MPVKSASNVIIDPDPAMLDVRHQQAYHFEVADNNLLLPLYGASSEHLRTIEQAFNVMLAESGNVITIKGDDDGVKNAKKTLAALLQKLSTHDYLTYDDLHSCIHMIHNKYEHQGNAAIHVRRNVINPRSYNQQLYIEQMQHFTLNFGIGPAGTGKTFLAVCYGVSLLINGQVDKIIVTRPAVEAGENLGFLPGDLYEKVDPYLQPINDALNSLLPRDEIERLKHDNVIEIAPLAYMRGRTLKNAFILLDEAQNANIMQMKMFFTRLGEHSYMVVTGDPTQVDLPSKTPSGLRDAVNRLRHIDDVGVLHFTRQDITRHPLVRDIVKAYDEQ